MVEVYKPITKLGAHILIMVVNKLIVVASKLIMVASKLINYFGIFLIHLSSIQLFRNNIYIHVLFRQELFKEVLIDQH